jgi:hypothetical protein
MKAKIENLMSRLHQQFGDVELTSQQQQLMDDMKRHLHNRGEPEPAVPDLRESVELLIEEIREEHPRAAKTAQEILHMLGNMGI